MLAHVFVSRFSFPTSLRLFPFYLLGPMIWHHRSQLVLFSQRIHIKYNVHREGTAMNKGKAIP